MVEAHVSHLNFLAMANRRILIVDDESVLLRVLSDALQAVGYDVRTASNGIEGLKRFKAEKPDLVIADVMMPDMDGMTMVERMRQEDNSVEILFLSARSGADDVVEGFRRGGNDYLRKPFALDELMARIEALLARHPASENHSEEVIAIGRYRFDSVRWTLSLDGSTQRLTARESAILKRLSIDVGHTVNSATLLMEIWGNDSYYNLRSLNVFVSRLRGYLSLDRRIEIQSIRGEGYRLIINDKE